MDATLTAGVLDLAFTDEKPAKVQLRDLRMDADQLVALLGMAGQRLVVGIGGLDDHVTFHCKHWKLARPQDADKRNFTLEMLETPAEGHLLAFSELQVYLARNEHTAVDVAIKPLQMELGAADVAREGLEDMKAAAEADGIGVAIEVGGEEHVLTEPAEEA